MWLFLSLNLASNVGKKGRGIERNTKNKNEQLIFQNISFYCFFFKYFIYSFMRDRERQRHRQREKQVPRGEPDVGLDPRTLGSRPEPKADAQPLGPRRPSKHFLTTLR